MAKRGCGSRKDGGLYVCVGLSPFGKPIEDFVLDPARPFDGRAFRAPMIVPGLDVNDILIWIGAEHYVTCSDYIEETRVLGVSRRIPRNFDTSQLTPGRSIMILIHSRAIPLFEFNCDVPVRNGKQMCRKPYKEHLCTFADWPLGTLAPCNDGRKIEFLKDADVKISLPSLSYQTTLPHRPLAGEPQPYQTGAFAAFPITHFEFIAKSAETKKSDLPDSIRHTGWEVEICDE